jgi:hypothetical protein
MDEVLRIALTGATPDAGRSPDAKTSGPRPNVPIGSLH